MPPYLQSLLKLAIAITTPALVYQISVTVFVCFSLVNAIADWFNFRLPQADVRKGNVVPPLPLGEGVRGWGHSPSLSVLIPARNEEATIAICLRSLLDANYSGKLEILVLNDRSEDRTDEIVHEIAAKDNRVVLLEGAELMPGWKGKPNALRQLTEKATGEILLLTDADCVFMPGGLDAAVAYREQISVDCLSLMPYFDCRSVWEHIIIPLQYFLVFTTLPIRNITGSRNPAFAAANGAFILIPTTTYRKLGGHEAVKGEMAEDIKFAQLIKKSGLRLAYADGTRTYSVRMYESLRGIWDGFSKNMYPAMGSNPVILSVWLLFQITTQILPAIFITFAIFRHDFTIAGFYLPLFQLLTALGIRFALSLRFRQSKIATITHILGWLIVVAIAINSAYLALSGKGHVWKGRVYQQ